MRLEIRPSPQLRDLARLAARFTRYRVPYCVVGGFATACYVPGRQPADVDLIIAPTAAAGQRALHALASLTVDQTAGADPVVALTDPAVLAAGEQLIVPTSWGSLHILGSHLPDSCDRAAIVNRRRWQLVGPWLVAICTRDDLIAIKQGARHGPDLDDVAKLRRTRRRP